MFNISYKIRVNLKICCDPVLYKYLYWSNSLKLHENNPNIWLEKSKEASFYNVVIDYNQLVICV